MPISYQFVPMVHCVKVLITYQALKVFFKFVFHQMVVIMSVNLAVCSKIIIKVQFFLFKINANYTSFEEC